MKGSTHPLLVLMLAVRLGLAVEIVAVCTARGRWSYALREVLGLLAYRLGALR